MTNQYVFGRHGGKIFAPVRNAVDSEVSHAPFCSIVHTRRPTQAIRFVGDGLDSFTVAANSALSVTLRFSTLPELPEPDSDQSVDVLFVSMGNVPYLPTLRPFSSPYTHVWHGNHPTFGPAPNINATYDTFFPQAYMDAQGMASAGFLPVTGDVSGGAYYRGGRLASVRSREAWNTASQFGELVHAEDLGAAETSIVLQEKEELTSIVRSRRGPATALNVAGPGPIVNGPRATMRPCIFQSGRLLMAAASQPVDAGQSLDSEGWIDFRWNGFGNPAGAESLGNRFLVDRRLTWLDITDYPESIDHVELQFGPDAPPMLFGHGCIVRAERGHRFDLDATTYTLHIDLFSRADQPGIINATTIGNERIDVLHRIPRETLQSLYQSNLDDGPLRPIVSAIESPGGGEE